MIGVLLTTAATREELAADWAAWLEAYGKPPAAVLGPKDLPFAFPEQGGDRTRFQGVPVLTLDDFVDLHGGDLDPDGYGPDDEDDEDLVDEDDAFDEDEDDDQ